MQQECCNLNYLHHKYYIHQLHCSQNTHQNNLNHYCFYLHKLCKYFFHHPYKPSIVFDCIQYRLQKIADEKIKKEDIGNLHFPKKEVLSSKDHKNRRSIKLQNATRLGNIEHYKVKIIFEDSQGLKMVHTTIWATTEKNISLKGGTTIPINRIREINIL